MLPGRAALTATCLAAFTLLILTLAPANAQRWGSVSNYVNITSAKVEQLSNAVRIVLKADGTLDTYVEAQQFWAPDEETGWWQQRELKRFSISLLNARSQVGRFVDVGAYPASHVTLSVPTEAREGVGLEVTLSLYVPARIGRVQRNRRVADWGQWWMPGPRVDMVLSDNQRELILTVHTERHYDTEQETAKRAPSREELVVEGSPERCCVRALNAPLQDVMDEIAKAQGASITLGPGIERRLTANLPPMPLPELLATICNTSCLNLTVQGGAYFINEGSVAEIGSYRSAPSVRIPLRNIPVAEALRLLPSCVLKHIQADAESNTLVAFGPRPLLDKIWSDLEVIDHAGRQIRLRVMVIEVRDSRLARRRLDALLEGGNTSVGLVPSEGRLRVGVVNQSLERIRLNLQSLEHSEAVHTDVRPEIVVTSGREAKLFVGKQQYYRFLAQTWGGVELQLHKVDVGVRLTATPWTGDGRVITVPFTVNADNIVSRDAEGLPLVARKEASGSLRIRAGQTIIFGGLRARDSFVQRQNIHPLEEAPLVGGLLRDKAVTHTNNEMLICLTADAV